MLIIFLGTCMLFTLLVFWLSKFVVTREQRRIVAIQEAIHGYLVRHSVKVCLHDFEDV